MLVMIIRDGGATKIPKDVADMDAVEALRAAGHVVEVPEAIEPSVGEVSPGSEAVSQPAAKKAAKKPKA